MLMYFTSLPNLQPYIEHIKTTNQQHRIQDKNYKHAQPCTQTPILDGNLSRKMPNTALFMP